MPCTDDHPNSGSGVSLRVLGVRLRDGSEPRTRADLGRVNKTSFTRNRKSHLHLLDLRIEGRARGRLYPQQSNPSHCLGRGLARCSKRRGA